MKVDWLTVGFVLGVLIWIIAMQLLTVASYKFIADRLVISVSA